ncbi:unnamed protein product [Oikopleura dioica]|uniref:Uncharacterized protein n=1 Tax=Oikopleura dioica TaxID=34765 RepID=E4XDX1_OIKDI|nr:unnamed protein product [Oikopleura dioica]
MTIDRAKRSWKSEKKHSHSYSIIYSDNEVSTFNIKQLVKNINPKLSGFVSSFVFYADEHEVYEYLQKKFPNLGVLGSKSKYIYLELSKVEPNDGIVYDEEIYFGTSCKSDIMIDFSNEEETNRNIEFHLTDILLSTKPKNFTREPLVKILEHVIIDSENGIISMDSLVKGYSNVRIHQNPTIILTWYNNLVDQMIRRMSIDGLELNYPPGLVNTGVLYGPTITQTHISLLKSLKLQPFSDTGNKHDPESCLNAVANYLEENELSTIALKVQITRVFNRKINDDILENESMFPWSQVISKIIESKLMRLHFKKEAREHVTVDDRLFRRFDTLPVVRKEIKRIERKSRIPIIPKRYKFQKPRELECLSQDDSFLDAQRPDTIDLDKAIDLDDTDSIFDKSQPHELNNAVTIETLFKGVESKFENEISKSKQTFVDAKGTIDTLKKDFERFQEMETLRAMVKSKPRPRDLTFMEHEKEILQAELDTKLTEIDLMVALSKKRRDEIKEEYENMEPEEVNFDPSDMMDLDESNNEPIDFEPSDISDVFSKEPTDLHEVSYSDDHQSGNYVGESRDSSQFKQASRNTVGMAVSDDESSAAPGRIYDNPLTSGPKKRLHDDESRMALSESDCESEQGKQMDHACNFVPSERLPMIDEQAGTNVDDDEIIGVSSQPCEINDPSWVLAPDSQDIKKPSQESLHSFVSDRSVISETQSLIGSQQGSQSRTAAVFGEDVNDYELIEDEFNRVDEIQHDESDQEKSDDESQNEHYSAYDSDGNRKHLFVDFYCPDSQATHRSRREQEDPNTSAEYISSQNTSTGSVEFVSQTQTVPETQFTSGDEDEPFVIPERQFSNDGNAPVFIEDSSNDSTTRLQNAASLQNVNEGYDNAHGDQFVENNDYDGDYGGFPLDEDDEDNMPLGYVFGQRSEGNADRHYGRPLNNAEFETWESGVEPEGQMIVREENEDLFHDELNRYSESEDSEEENVQYEVPCNRQYVPRRRPLPQNDDDEVICLDSD